MSALNVDRLELDWSRAQPDRGSPVLLTVDRVKQLTSLFTIAQVAVVR